MQITINGKITEVKENSTIVEVISAFKNINIEDIVVEYNGHIIDNNIFNKTIVKKGDTIEVVSFVCGG